MQHDGNVIARLIAALSARLLRATFPPVAAPCRIFRMASPNFARLDRGNRSSEWVVKAQIFFRRRERPKRGHPSAHYFDKTYIVRRKLYSYVIVSITLVNQLLKNKITEYLSISRFR